jgi:Golgi nucleoside diphosphatase
LAADSVAELLETAKATIPSHLWHQTPLALKATAGLRLLSENQVDEILDAVIII